MPVSHIENFHEEEWVLIYDPPEDPMASIPLQIKGLSAPYVLAVDIDGCLHSLDLRYRKVTHVNDGYVGNFLAFCQAQRVKKERKNNRLYQHNMAVMRAMQQQSKSEPLHPSNLPSLKHLWPGFPGPPPPEWWDKPEDGENPFPVFTKPD